MKSLYYILILILCLSYIKNKVYCQTPDFKFHLAFEDATGAKDTVWAVWDSTANSFPGTYDTIWGEFPDSLPNDTNFRVYIRYNVTDSGKVRAEPTSNPAANGFYIRAVNYVYPVIVRWDSSLFNQNPSLFEINKASFQNDYFFLNWNDPSYPNEFNMLITDSVELPTFGWGSQDHFPLDFQMQSFITGIEQISNPNSFNFYPNPSNSKIYLSVNDNIQKFQLSVFGITGKAILQFNTVKNYSTIDLSELQKGSYFLKISYQDKVYVKPLIKY